LDEIKFLHFSTESIIYSTFSGKSDFVSFDEITCAKIIYVSTQFSRTPTLILFSKEKQIRIPLILGNSKNNLLLNHFSKNLKTTIQNETSLKFDFQKTL
jgi:hypothetical protein